LQRLTGAFQGTLQTLYEIYSTLQANGRNAGAQLTNDELSRVLAALQGLHGAMEGCPVDTIFEQVQPEIMRSFLDACVQQIVAGFGAQHLTLRDEVCFFFPLSLSVPSLDVFNSVKRSVCCHIRAVRVPKAAIAWWS
jgi:hypothetical protein